MQMEGGGSIMTDDSPHPDRFFASRLDLLFRTVHPQDRKPYTAAEVAKAINDAAGENAISAGYVWQLRTGRRDNPTYRQLIALSRFFDVSPTFFFEEAETQRGAIPADAALALKDDAIREIALRAAGLSDRSLKTIADMIANARALEDSSLRRTRRPARQRGDA
jgi:transcriptional regulator with XRE-family HTH domain